MTKLESLTSNQYYGGLNRRFSKRAALLRKLGYSYKQVEGLPIAIFTKSGWGRTKVINASSVMLAPKRHWFELLRNPPIARSPK